MKLSSFLLKLYVTFGFHSSSNTKGKGKADELQTLEQRLYSRESAVNSSAAELKQITFASVSLPCSGGRKEREQRRVREGQYMGAAHRPRQSPCPAAGFSPSAGLRSPVTEPADVSLQISG